MSTRSQPSAQVEPAPQDRHIPVLAERIVELLAPALQPREDGRVPVFVDATLGMAGHAQALLAACPHARLIGIDRDPQALALAAQRLADDADRVRFVHAVYDEFEQVLADEGLDEADAVLLDLGVSSLQLDEAERGFAYAQDAALDMRMDPTTGPTAADVLNSYDADRLSRVLSEYGEERFARRIAAAIVRERGERPFTTSAQLVDLLRRTVPAASQRTGGHPAKRTFQALRIEVNGELDALAAVLPQVVDNLAVGGRVAVLSYHSLEDRMVKRALATASRSSAPLDLPVEPVECAAQLRLLSRGGEVPTAAEVLANPRSASAHLRAAERIRPRPSRSSRPGRSAAPAYLDQRTTKGAGR